MSKYIRIVILLLVLLAAVMMTSWVAAQSDTGQPNGNIVIPGSIFVRGGPGEQFTPVGALYEGDVVTPINRSVDGFWIFIPYNRSFGWIQRNLIRWENEAALDLLPILEANVTPTPIVSTRAPVVLPTFTPEGNYVRLVDAESAFLRAGPGRTYLRLGQLLPGEQVEPVSRNEEGNWILIRYTNAIEDSESLAWIARSLVSWEDEAILEELPIIDEDDLTPTLTFTPSDTPEPSDTATVTDIPTDTASPTDEPTDTAVPSDTPTDEPSDTPIPSDTPTDEPSDTPIPSDTPTDEPSDTPVPSDTPTDEPSDTPVPSDTPTDEPSDTPVPSDTPTDEPSDTPVPSDTPTDEPSDTPVPSDTPTDEPSDTPVPSDTPTDEPSDTPVPSDTPSDTPVPSDTPTDEPTDTPVPSDTPTDEPTDTPVPSDTPTDEPSDTPVPSDTPSDTPIPSDTPTDEPSDTPIPSDTPTDEPTDTPIPSDTPTDEASDTPIPSDTPTDEPTDTPIPSDTPTDEPTQVAAVIVETGEPSDTPTDEPSDTPIPSDTPTEEASEQAIVLPETAIPTEPIVVETVPDDGGGGSGVPVEAIIGISILLIVLGYIFLFWRGLVAADRYRNGFVIEECPVCNRGGLTVEEKLGRLLGIPQTRRTVRCDVCRSVLRETGAGRWRYAVDRIENATMYDRFNGKEITDDDLGRLSTNPPQGSARPTNPEFVDEDNPDTSGS